jgi:D-serine deaminase-like pyridoxal phosphate-dependent protein
MRGSAGVACLVLLGACSPPAQDRKALAAAAAQRLPADARLANLYSHACRNCHANASSGEPESPPGLEYNRLYGRSSNQELLTGSRSVSLAPDDYLFLRPTQSEAVLLQFGDLVVYEDGHVTQRWPTFGVSA